MDKNTTVQLRREVLAELKKCKKYRRETHSDQIKRLIEKERRIK